MNYYFIDDFDNICRQKDSMDKDFAEVIELVDIIDDINKLAEENQELKSKYSEQCIQLDFLKDENQHMRDLVNENEQLKKAWKYNCEICEKSKKFRQYEVKTECEDFELDLEKVLK